MEIPDDSHDVAQSIVYRTADGGVTWTPVFSLDGQISGIEVSALDPQVVVLTTTGDVLRSTSGGAADSWESIRPEAAQGLRALALSPHRAGVYVVGTNNQGIWYTADAGATWTNNPLDGFFEQHVSATDPARLDPEIANAQAPGLVLRRNISVITFAPQSEDTFYVAGRQGARASVGVARITLGGTHWERLPLAGLSHRNVYAMAIDAAEQFLYAGTNDGIFGLALR
jgi:photosystem II stability/assembly factor-like uncharacterized protein